MRWFIICIILFSSVLSIPVGASDCSNTQNRASEVICSDPALSRLNIRLQQVLEKSEQISFDRGRLVADQNDWLNKLDRCNSDRACIRHSLINRVENVWDNELANEFGLAIGILDNAYNKYGTAYSGGEHGQRLDNVGATIDLYRALIGLPLYNFSNEANEFDPWDFDLYETDVDRLLIETSVNKSIVSEQPLLSAEQKYEISVAYDLAIPMGDNLDWWLEERENLSQLEWVLNFLATSDDSVDWMIASMSASYLPWALDWHLPYNASLEFEKSRRNVIEYAASKFSLDNQLQWLTIISMFMITSDEEVELVEHQFNVAMANLLGGTSDQLDYLLVNLLGYELARIQGHDFFIENQFIFTDVLKHYLIERLYKQHLFEYMTSDNASVRKRQIMDLASVTDEPFYLSKIGVALAYSSTSFSEFLSHFNFILEKAEVNLKATTNTDFEQLIDAKIFRLMNIFSIDELKEVLSSSKFNFENNRMIRNVLLNRSFVLDDYETFNETLDGLYWYLSDEQRISIDNIKNLNLTQKIEAALIIFELKKKSLWISGGNFAPDVMARNEHFYKSGTDLNDNFLSGDFLDRDLNVFLMLPQEWDASWSMCCRNIIQRLARASDRGSFDNIGFNYSELAIDFNSSDSLFNGNNNRQSIIAEFHPDTGLAFKLSQTIIEWHQNSGTRWYWKSRHHDLIAEMLATVVRLQKRNATAKLNGKYLGQTAFSILKTSYADTISATETKYWFKCERNCR